MQQYLPPCSSVHFYTVFSTDVSETLCWQIKRESILETKVWRFFTQQLVNGIYMEEY